MVVYTVGSLLRVVVTGAAAKIMFQDLPYVDRIMEMIHVRPPFSVFFLLLSFLWFQFPCLITAQDIYIAREVHGYVLEEELFRELIELYRDPEALIDITKVKDE